MRIFTTALAIASGIFVLLGYFFPSLEFFRLILVNWAIILAGMAILVGIFNLAAVQMEKFRARQKGGVYGGLLVLALVFTFGLGFLFSPQLGLFSDKYYESFRTVAVNGIIVPVEASLMAILAVTLIYASIRLLRRRVDVMSVVFLGVALLFLFLTLPIIPGNQVLLNRLGMFSQGGARGLLIGIALGTLLTGLRVLFGVDRPYGGK